MNDNDQTDFNLIKDVEQKYKVDLRKRLLEFAVAVIRFLMKIQDSTEIRVVKYQLSKSATSIGANYEEAQSSSRKEFIHKVRIALREANESKYWLKILSELSIGDSKKLETLFKESNEISLILGAIVSKMDRN